ncbi:type IV secretory system conjugative DNA transfer family protein [Neisseria sp. Ec49-e6-T10]|uniref:type IV secretory system conjugative DNA transfer family protein n=1 Tax=Neisseria sp. Ec49-e6-T10 TaxID=3140744 RepID=UPI003EBFEB06
MSTPKKGNMALLILMVTLVFLAIGQFAGSFLLSFLLDIEFTWSPLLLIGALGQIGRYPETVQHNIYISLAVSVAMGILPSIMLLAAMLIKPKRELHGSARFANPMEMNQSGLLALKHEKPDILVGKYNGKFLRWGSNEFAFLAAPTRSGKGVGIVIPNCLHYRDSMVVFDPKLENYLLTAGFRHKHGHKVFLFNPAGRTPEHETRPHAPLVSHRWNPLTYVRRNPVYTYKDAMNIATILYPKSTRDSSNSTFFTESAQKLFVGLLLYMIETEGESGRQTTLTNLFRLTVPKNGDPLSEWIIKEMERRHNSGQLLSSQCTTLLLGFANGNAKTGSDILATVTAPLSIFLDPVVEAATSSDDFYLDDVRKQRMTIYLGVIPTETDTFSRLTNLFFSQLISVNVAQGLPENNPALKYQCLLLMDEFTALGAVPIIESGVAYIAGYNLRLLLIFQSPSQVTRLYTKEGTRTFFTNFGLQIFYPPRDQQDAKEYSDMIGYETYKAKSLSRSKGRGGSSTSQSDQRRAVLNPDELKIMPRTDCIISMTSSRPILAKKIIYYEDEVFKPRVSMALPQIPELFVNITQAVEQPEPIAPEELETVDLAETSNASALFEEMIKSLVRPDSPPEFISALAQSVKNNLGVDSMPIISRLMQTG